MTLRCRASLLTAFLPALLGLGGFCPRPCEAICPSKPPAGRAPP